LRPFEFDGTRRKLPSQVAPDLITTGGRKSPGFFSRLSFPKTPNLHLNLYSVYDASGVHFDQVDEQQVLTLLEHNAAKIEGKRRKIRLRLTVDHSAARVLLAPRYQLSQGSRTVFKEYLGDDRRFVYQHSERCAGFGAIG